MKKAIKISLILAGVLFALGLTLHTAGAAMGGRRESAQYYEDRWADICQDEDWGPILVSADGVHIGGENGIHVDSDGVSVGGERGIHVGQYSEKGDPGEKRVLESGELLGITAIKVDIDCGDIRVQEGESFAVFLNWNLSNYAMGYEVEKGVLKVEDESWESFHTSMSFDIDCTALITVPSGAVIDELDLSTDMGDIEVDAAVTAKKADLSTNLGDMNCSGLQARELEVESDLGDIKLYLPGSRDDYSWELETDMGEILLDGEEQNGGIGTITNYGGFGKNMVEVTASLGNIEVYFE